MKKVLIVEDDEIIRAEIVKIIKSICEKIEILETGFAQEALNLSEKHYINAFILDIQLLDYSGLELAKEIREQKQYYFTPIVFITAVPTRELEAFKTTHCYEYIIKPFRQNEVYPVLEKIIHYGSQGVEKQTIKLVQKAYTYEIDLEDIIYIEVKYKKLYIVTINEVLTYTSYTLIEIMEMLTSEFIRCHRSYIVNRNYIKGINRGNSYVELKGTKDIVPYGRQYQDVLRGEWI